VVVLVDIFRRRGPRVTRSACWVEGMTRDDDTGRLMANRTGRCVCLFLFRISWRRNPFFFLFSSSFFSPHSLSCLLSGACYHIGFFNPSQPGPERRRDRDGSPGKKKNTDRGTTQLMHGAWEGEGGPGLHAAILRARRKKGKAKAVVS